jgi:hypothetical protein
MTLTSEGCRRMWFDVCSDQALLFGASDDLGQAGGVVTDEHPHAPLKAGIAILCQPRQQAPGDVGVPGDESDLLLEHALKFPQRVAFPPALD